jgi:Rrf2 family protein
MRLNAKIEYGILAVVDLADSYGRGPAQSHMIAKRQAIPIRFLEQVLSLLRKAGIVESLRGALGGYTLARSPETIHLNEVVEAIEGPVAVVSCLSSNGPCRHEQQSGACALKEVGGRLQRQTKDLLHEITIMDLKKLTHDRMAVPMFHI